MSKKADSSKRAKVVAEAAKAVEPLAAEVSVRKGSRPTDVFLGEFRRRDIFPLLILHFCAKEPAYGNSIIAQIGDLTAGMINANPNTIYPLLRELEGNGFIEGQWEHPEKRSRRFYSITEAGAEEYKRMKVTVEPFLDSIINSVTLIKKEIYV